MEVLSKIVSALDAQAVAVPPLAKPDELALLPESSMTIRSPDATVAGSVKLNDVAALACAVVEVRYVTVGSTM